MKLLLLLVVVYCSQRSNGLYSAADARFKQKINLYSTGHSECWLGIDLSTQSVSVVLLSDETGVQPIANINVNFENDLPQYKTASGMHVSDGIAPGDNAVVTSPVTMWLDGLDIALTRLSGSPSATSCLKHIAGISVSGQQHGTVYWKHGASQRLKNMADSSLISSLNEVLSGSFALRDCPIWADSSTVEQCKQMETAMGGPIALAKATGSSAYPRFSGIQISKIASKEPEKWQQCERVSLVSSFVTSLLIGSFAPIDKSDASGMNLMDIVSRDWHPAALQATNAENLLEKLGNLVDSHSVVGTLGQFFSVKYGLPKDCPIIAGSGDNPCSLAAMGITGEEGQDVVVSLGTSDTAMGATKGVPNPQSEGHVMASALDPSASFVMLVYKNGGLMREAVRNADASGSWDTFEEILTQTQPGNGGKLGLFLNLPEITPQVNAIGCYYAIQKNSNEISLISEDDMTPAERVRASVEGRFLSMRARLAKMGVENPTRVLAVGGASKNKSIMQVLSDVFDRPVYTGAISDAAAVGAALRAKHGVLCSRAQKLLPFSSVLGSFESRGLTKVATPNPMSSRIYPSLLQSFYQLETEVQNKAPPS